MTLPPLKSLDLLILSAVWGHVTIYVFTSTRLTEAATKENSAQMFSWEFCGISKNTCFIEHLWTYVSGLTITKFVRVRNFGNSFSRQRLSRHRIFVLLFFFLDSAFELFIIRYPLIVRPRLDLFHRTKTRYHKNYSLRSQSTLKIENFKINFFLVHDVPIRLKWSGNMFF